MFTTKQPWALDLCRRIGFEDQLIHTNAEYRRAYIVHRGRLVRVPEGFSLMSPVRFWPIATTPLLSLGGKLRAAPGDSNWWLEPLGQLIVLLLALGMIVLANAIPSRKGSRG